MGNPIRNKDPRIYRLITIRTLESRLWIAPSNNVKKLIGGIIARYQEKFQIEIYAYKVLGNHIHLLARAPKSNMDEFEENVNREIARRLNWKHHRIGKFWEKRYGDHEVLSEDDLLEAFLYVTTNATKHGLVRDSRDWEGLNSFRHCLNEQDRIFTFYHYSAPEGQQKTTSHKLRLTILPHFAGLSKTERGTRIEKLLNERMEQIAQDRKAAGQGFLGREAIREQQPGAIPLTTARKPSPPCYTKSAKLRRAFRISNRELRKAYSEASFYYRLGQRDYKFPSNTFLPPAHRLPRLVPFTPLSPENFKKVA